MKQFAYNLAYKCKNIWESEELSKYLEDLGHKKYGILNYSIETPFIINRANNYSGSYCFNEEVKYHVSPNREEIFDKELFLALCAQTLDKEFYPGELVIAIGDKKHTNTAKNGSIAKVTSEKYYSNICDTDLIDVEWIKTVPENCGQQNGGYWIDYFRKMTKEEIENYFNKQKPMEVYQDYIVETNSIDEANEVVRYCKVRFGKDYSIAIKDKCWYRIDNSKSYYGHCQNLAWYKERYPKWEIIDFNYWKQMINKTNMTKKVIGYKLIKEYPNSAKLNSIVYNDLMNCSKYPEFWEPQYQEEKKTITIPCEGGSFDVTIEKDKMVIDRDTLNKYEVSVLIDRLFPKGLDTKLWKININSLDIGCKKGIKIQDLQILKQEWDKING